MTSLIHPYLPSGSKSKDIFEELMKKATYKNGEDPHMFVKRFMNFYEQKHSNENGSIRGKVFEFTIGEALLQNSIVPSYYQARLQHVSLAVFDWLLYNSAQLVLISAKPKAKTQWKQVAYEGLVLKKVYPQAMNYLVTIEPVSKPEEKIKESSQTIDSFVVATDQTFTDMISTLSQMNFQEVKPISPIVDGFVMK